MSPTSTTTRPRRRTREPGVGCLVLVAFGFVALQQTLTDRAEVDGSWFAVGVLLLAAVLWGRSRLARALLVVVGWSGAVVLAYSALAEPHLALPALAFLGQAVPMMSADVRRHVGSSNQAPARSPYAWAHSFASSS